MPRDVAGQPGRRALAVAAGAAIAMPVGTGALAQPRPAGRGNARTPPAPTGTPAQTPVGPFETVAKQALIIDADTDAVLLEKNADDRMPPSSMSKLMTLYVVFDLLKQGRLQLAQQLPVSEKAWRMGGSRMFLQIGTSVSVENLIQGVIVHSGNDACVVLAEGVAGSEAQFADLLNQKGRAIGLTGSNFRNATGWPDPEHRMTSRDLGRLAKRIIADFPEDYRYFAERTFRWNEITQDNRNPLLGRFAGADGLKTGHTEEAGYGLTASARRGDRRLILVVNGLTSMRQRVEESERLLEWGFREFENVVLFRAAEVIEEVPVYLGQRPTVPLVGGRDMVVTLPRQWRQRLQARLRYDAPIQAPVLKGRELGRLEVSGQGVPPLSLPLLAGADVDRLGLLPRIPAVIGRWVAGS